MSDVVEFQPWPKIARINKPVVFTEKIDGTNAAIGVRQVPLGDVRPFETVVVDPRFERPLALRAQSRKRLITPTADNFGFARWAFERAEILAPSLGEGLHYGEWWGKGIQRGYGMDTRVFSLFDTSRWSGDSLPDELHAQGVDVVPVLWNEDGALLSDGLHLALGALLGGSVAAAQYGRDGEPAEGVCIYHTASGAMHKYLMEDPDTPKSRRQVA